MPTQHNYRCRACDAVLQDTFVDLGASPPSNAYLDVEQLQRMEPTFPLHAYVCRVCYLVQVPQHTAADELFTADYAYFSSYSDTWLAHARAYVERAVERLGLTTASHVVEVASNDGYLLQYVTERGIRARGIEPTRECAEAARLKGIATSEFFLGAQTGKAFAAEFGPADLVAANNVLAHVPDLHDFVAGLRALLAPRGTLTIEFPHLLELMQNNQFDTIYHEHFSYFSLLALEPVLLQHDLRVVDVDQLSTHGGSLRLWVEHADAGGAETVRLAEVRELEKLAGLDDLATYGQFASRAAEVKRNLLAFLIEAARAGKRVAAYGAAAKGNTLLNYCGVRSDAIDFVADRNPHKRGKWLPGSRIPIVDPVAILERKPDYVVILPWNIKEEVMDQMRAVRDYGGQFVVAVPHLEVLP
jgi:SAM-dependent methyltransferase